MVASDYVGSASAFGQLLRNVDVQFGEFENVCWAVNSCRRLDGGLTVVAAERFAKFFKALADGDRAAADSVLRCWGIRR